MTGDRIIDESTQRVAAERKAFYDTIDGATCTPLWEVLHGLVTAEPNTPCLPYLWKWAAVWPWLQEGGQLISAKEAERRVLVLENPGLRARSAPRTAFMPDCS